MNTHPNGVVLAHYRKESVDEQSAAAEGRKNIQNTQPNQNQPKVVKLFKNKKGSDETMQMCGHAYHDETMHRTVM